MIVRPILIICAWMLLAACNQYEKNTNPALTTSLSNEALVYLSSALDTLQMHSINRDAIDWDDLRQRAFEQAQGATQSIDTYSAIQEALRLLGDRHSFFIPPEDAEQWKTNAVHQVPVPPSAEMLNDHIGYIRLPGALVVNADSIQKYVARLHRHLLEVDTMNPCGWMLDLRSNWGGNMWAMLAGIGPVLGEGIAGMGHLADGRLEPWFYTGKSVVMDTTVIVELEEPIQLRKASLPVAVLTSRNTGSSGEAVAVFFRGRAATRSFGEGTAGVPTGNKMFMLSDGAAIALTISRFADRTGRVYSGSIEPDTLVVASEEGDAILEAAQTWIETQKSCQISSVQDS